MIEKRYGHYSYSPEHGAAHVARVFDVAREAVGVLNEAAAVH